MRAELGFEWLPSIFAVVRKVLGSGVCGIGGMGSGPGVARPIARPGVGTAKCEPFVALKVDAEVGADELSNQLVILGDGILICPGGCRG